MLSIEHIRGGLAAHAPQVISIEGSQRAAVAVVLQAAGDDVSVLFIERSERTGDPWSGHMAFPGGRVDPGDSGPCHAAERETREETGLDLSGAERLGRLDDLEGRGGHPGLVVSAFVYLVSAPGPLAPNYEVREAFWVPLSVLVAPERQVKYPFPRGASSHFPAILVGNERQIVWGLTYRFVEIMIGALGLALPPLA